MKYFEYSPSQLEQKANELIEKHDKERLIKAKHIDVYDIVDLIGLDIYTEDGELLGKLDDVFNSGSCDIYVVKDELGKQLLLPAISDVIKEINLNERKIVAHLLKGLV